MYRLVGTESEGCTDWWVQRVRDVQTGCNLLAGMGDNSSQLSNEIRKYVPIKIQTTKTVPLKNPTSLYETHTTSVAVVQPTSLPSVAAP